MYDRARTCALNDKFRQTMVGGRVVVTAGIAARPDVKEILAAVRRFSAFTEENNPFGEHDFGSFQLNDALVFFKLDYYDSTLNECSPDPADESVTTRVLTILLADEY